MAPQEAQIVKDEDPEESTFAKGDDFHFIFLVDRSQSMTGRRMLTTKQTLNLFL